MSNTELATVADESRQLDHMKPTRLTDSLFSKDLAPHYMKLAGQLASSEMVPKCFRNKPADLFLAWSMGYQIGIPPEQAMQCIAVVNGRASMWGDDMLALCMAHKDFEDIIEEPIMKDGKVFGYTCTVKRRGMEPKSNKFDLNDAKKAGLLGKPGPWTQYEERMLKLRARGFSLRDAFPDALKGIKPREEVEDYIDADYTVTKTSRTDVLKRELKGVGNADLVYGVVPGMANGPSSDENSSSGEAFEDCKEQPEMAEAREETAELHAKIRQLIEETGFTQSELEKALKFYQVEKIEDLGVKEANHFTLKLTKGQNNG